MNKLFVPVIVSLVALVSSLWAEESKLVVSFQDAELGDPPDDLLVLAGEFQVIEEEGNKLLMLPAEPLEENGIFYGKSSQAAMTAEARFRAGKKRRTAPRFGVGVYGVSGYRLRVVPGKKHVELVHREDQVLATQPYTWKADKWCHVRLAVIDDETSGKRQIKGWVWTEGEEAPDDPIITFETDDKSGRGKPSVWGTPYAGKPIYFDDLTVTTK